MGEFRRELINELKKHPEKLPHNTQPFIPTEYRNKDDKTKYIQNISAYQQKEQNLNINNRSIWPIPTHASLDINNPMYVNLRESVQFLNNELQEMKKKYENDLQKLKNKYKEHLDALNQTWLIMHQQQQTFQQMLTIMNTNIKQVTFIARLKTTKTMFNVLNRIKTNSNNYDEVIQELGNHIEYLREAELLFTAHINSLELLVEKQNGILNRALDSLFEDPNV